MLLLIARRLLQMPLILAVIFAVTLTLAWVIPGNPLERPEGQRPPPEVAAAMLRQYNLHDPWAFASSYLSNLLFKGDWGPSLRYGDQRVGDILAQGLPVSASLGVAALVVALAIGTAAGVIGALRPGSVLDGASLAVALVGVSLPCFVTGSILLVVFAGTLRWLPVGGWGSPSQVILPALTLGVAPAAYIARLIRLGLADVMASDFIRTARAKGLSHHRALFKHALKVAFLPVLSFLGPAAAAAMTGSFVVEQVFNIPGLGEHFVNAVLNKDQFLILGIVLTYSTMLVLFNLAVDVAYAWIDPRIEL
ncbi:MAG TPA: ABC transporter permease [Phycisphaeraceae bacterium]